MKQQKKQKPASKTNLKHLAKSKVTDEPTFGEAVFIPHMKDEKKFLRPLGQSGKRGG